ncbi:MAG TPA: FabA/FabZ family ACP-dehydratase [Syntrophales bacterium]|nr:FabA/FabZ family ACP-dehydratase [Syntrophales bacterium]
MSRPFRYELSLSPDAGDRIDASARIPADSAWFDGHFPDNPIVPGVALIGLVEEAVLRSERDRGRTVEMTGIRRVRFRLPVKPDDPITLQAVREVKRGTPAFVFNVCLEGEIACSGILSVTAAEPIDEHGPLV